MQEQIEQVGHIANILKCGDNDAELEYNTGIWRSLRDFSANMMEINEQYRKSTRKRKSPPPSPEADPIASPPARKKQKTSHSSSKPKSPKKTTKSSKKSTKKKDKKTPKKQKKDKKKDKKKPTKSPKTKAKSKTKISTPSKMDADGKIYKIRRPRSSWVLFNAFKTAKLLEIHQHSTLGQRTQMSSKVWNAMTDEIRSQWQEKAENEKLQYEKYSKEFEKHEDFNLIPTSWKQIDKKAQKARNEKLKQNQAKKKGTSPKKGKGKKTATSPKKGKGKKKKKKKDVSEDSDSSSASDSDSESNSSNTSYGGTTSSDSDEEVTPKKKKKKVRKKSAKKTPKKGSKSPKKKSSKSPKKERGSVKKGGKKATESVDKKKTDKTSSKTPTVVTRKAAKSMPDYTLTAPLTSGRRKATGGTANESEGRSGPLPDLVEKMTESKKKESVGMKALSQISRERLLSSQPADVMSEDDSDDELSSIDGLRGVIPRTPDKDMEIEGEKDKNKNKKKMDLDQDSDASSSDEHFGV